MKPVKPEDEESNPLLAFDEIKVSVFMMCIVVWLITVVRYFLDVLVREISGVGYFGKETKQQCGETERGLLWSAKCRNRSNIVFCYSDLHRQHLIMATGFTALCLFIGGWIVFPGLFILQLQLWMKTDTGRRLKKQYDLSEKDCSDIANKLVSAFQAILATTTGTIVCSSCYDDVLHRTHALTLIYAWFGLPYFFYDTISMFYVSTITDLKPKESYWKKFYRFALKSPVIVIHHIVLAPVGFTLLWFFRDGVNNGDFFMGTVYLMEASTPFVCLRFILSKFRMKSTAWYAVNGLLMLVLFPVFRIVSLFYAAYLYGSQQQISTSEALYEMPCGWKMAFFLAVAPQIYWYFLMWRGLLRIISKKGRTMEYEKKFDETNVVGSKPASRRTSLSGLNGAKEFAH